MTTQQIKDNAPEGATHYHKNIFAVRYYKRYSSGELFKVYLDGIWTPSFIAPHKLKPL